MIYFDYAATSFPKPQKVRKAVGESFLYYGANPGRSGHRLSVGTARKIFEAREKASELFGAKDPENVVFTKNCTESINAVLMSTAKEKGHFIISDLEHNSVLRPVYELKNRGMIDFSVAETFWDDPLKTAESFERLIRKDTKLIMVTGASNVLGTKLPIKMLGKIAREHGILFAVDAAQTAGNEKIDMEKENIDFMCVPGHKGLLGPMGTGMMIARRPELVEPLVFGGTGNYSLFPTQPQELPEKAESGTLNVPGICGLLAGMETVDEKEEELGRKESELAVFIYDELMKTEGVKVFSERPVYENSAPIVSFVMGDFSGEETAEILSRKGVAARGGFHCSALAHFKAKTEKRGLCRVSTGWANTFGEAEKLIKIIREELKN